MKEKCDPYSKLFSTFSGVRLEFCHSEIFYTIVKVYYTKNNDSPLIHRSHLRPIHMLSEVLDVVVC